VVQCNPVEIRRYSGGRRTLQFNISRLLFILLLPTEDGGSEVVSVILCHTLSDPIKQYFPQATMLQTQFRSKLECNRVLK
jgi:hypothetical protein